ncbi:hypothetical protein J4234_01645 [Candidatus Woesearchaeota archaeon]|nr:hypothetical protein [Candidatus Woesearchaeota archaeon]
MASPRELVEELSNLKAEASKLRNALDELDREKESWFKKRDDCSKRIRESIQKIKENKSKRDYLTNEVKELKPKRNSINKGISAKLNEFDSLKKEKTALARSLGIKDSPSRIKNQMDKLEFKIETDTVSFEKEKELMKKIKELKKVYNDAIVLDESSKKLRDSSDEIRKMRKEANEIHRSIQEKAKQSQALHDEILKISAEIDKMKEDEEASFNKFSEYKKQFTDVNSNLKEKLRGINYIKGQLDRVDSDRRERKKRHEESILKSKEELVNEKIRKGQKLTTEDLLVFQKFGRE